MRIGTIIVVVSLIVGAAWAELLTSMPEYPKAPSQYVSKWDPFMVKPFSKTTETLSRNNGRQIARNTAGTWFVLLEQDQKAVYLGCAAGKSVVGGDFETVELVGTGPKAVFKSEGAVQGASMVIDREDKLHVIWLDGGALRYATRNVKDLTPDNAKGVSSWSAPKQLAKAPCSAGDIMLDAAGEVAVCYARQDAVYYHPIFIGKLARVCGVGTGLDPLTVPSLEKEQKEAYDPAKPTATVPKKASYPPPMPIEDRSCAEPVMDLGPDGSIHLAFRREFEIWYARRTPDGVWQKPERAAFGLSFHPAIIAASDKPLICFQFEGTRKVTLGGEDYIAKREGGSSGIGYAFRTDQGWRTDFLAKAEEIIVNRQGIWDKRFEGKLLPMVEEMWRPVLFRDRHGVAWALWQNTTRRWSYCARWMGESFGEVQECRGPFDAPGQSVSAEKLMPAIGDDVGLLFFAANRIIFDRMRIPTLSLVEAREVMFLDSLEVGATKGVEFVVNQMTKHPANPVLSPGPPGSREDRHVRPLSWVKRGDKYVLRYRYQSWDDDAWKTDGLAISSDGVVWEKVDHWPEGVQQGDGLPTPKDPMIRGYFDNPDQSDPAKMFMRTDNFGPVWHQGSKRVLYSPDGKNWTYGPEISILNAIYEGSGPNLYDTLDIPERCIKVYGRVFTTNSRSCGMMWSQDLLHWGGAEHYLDPDDPYGKAPGNTSQGPMRGQVFLDACAGKAEDQIYSCNVRIVDGLYFCIYWPNSFEHRAESALAVSRDGYNFSRVKNGSRTLAVGPAGAWDSGQAPINWPERDGDILRVYYQGNAYHHGVEPYRPDFRIGLATIRANSWTYYTPKADGYSGTVTTIPITAPEGVRKSLSVNFDHPSGAGNKLLAEILDAATSLPLPGFSAADCASPVADGLYSHITWKGGDHLPTGQPICIRFHLLGRGVRLFSFGFRQD